MNTIQAQDLLKTERVYKATSNSTLKEALTKLTRTHDAIFVIDNGKFLGVINPYYTIFKSNYPPDTKLSRCLYKPPILTLTTSIWDIARLMNESKIYYLPIVENNAFIGIVTANRVIKALIKDKDLVKNIKFNKKFPLITIKSDATLSEGYNLMRDKQVSRLPVVTDHGRLVGIVSRHDIQTAFTEPQKHPRFMSRKGTKEKYLQHPIERYYKKIVITTIYSASNHDIINKIIDNNVGSAIVIDKHYHPIGIISTYDILKAVSSLRPKSGHSLDIALDKDFIHHVRLNEILNKFKSKILKRYQVSKITFSIKTKKNPAGKVRKFKTTGTLKFFSKGKSISATSTDYDWKKSTRMTLEKLKNQLPSKK